MDDELITSVRVTNTGDRQGDQVVQLYIGFDNSGVEREHKLLKGFCRVSLMPGESRRITLRCPFDRLRYYDPETDSWVLEDMEYQVYTGSSSDENDLLKGTFRIEQD